MAWCPICSYEYLPGMSRCPDCGSPLRRAPGLDEAIRSEDRDWITIRVVGDPIQAEMVKALLESQGFDVAVRNGVGSIRAIVGDGTVAAGGEVYILVPLDSAPKAAELLRSHMHWTESELTHYMEEHGYLGSDDEYDDDDERTYLQSNGLMPAAEDDDDFS